MAELCYAMFTFLQTNKVFSSLKFSLKFSFLAEIDSTTVYG